MPTTVTSKIGATNSPTTMDYSTLQAWEDACPANLVTDDKIWKGECYDQGEFTGTSTRLTISGETTDATRYVWLTCAAGASFKDKAGVRTTALAYNASNGVAIRVTSVSGITISIATNNTLVEGLQAAYNGAYGQSAIGVSGTGVRVSQCILKNFSTAGGQAAQGVQSAVFTNCLLEVGVNGNAQRGQYFGCTFVRTGTAGGTGVSSQYNQAVLKNCAVFNFTTLKSGTLAAGSDYNATDLATAWGTGSNNLNSLTFASQFVSSSDFRAVDTGGLKAGTPDSTNTPNDITGFARDATTPYIGCWEVVAAAAGGSPGIIGGGVGSGAYILGA